MPCQDWVALLGITDSNPAPPHWSAFVPAGAAPTVETVAKIDKLRTAGALGNEAKVLGDEEKMRGIGFFVWFWEVFHSCSVLLKPTPPGDQVRPQPPIRPRPVRRVRCDQRGGALSRVSPHERELHRGHVFYNAH